MPDRVTLIGDLLLVAGAQLETPAEELLQATSLDSDPAFGTLLTGLEETDPPPTIIEVAAICGAWVVRNKPFPRDNSKIGYRFICLLLDGAGESWRMSQEDARGAADIRSPGRRPDQRIGVRRLGAFARGYGLGGTWGSPSP